MTMFHTTSAAFLTAALSLFARAGEWWIDSDGGRRLRRDGARWHLGWGIVLVGAMSVVGRSSHAGTWREEFASDPAARGWQVFGEPSLFAWNTGQQQLDAIWDSSRPNSFFYRPLGTILTKQDDFSLQFDLRLESIAVGVNPSKPFTFQLALGFIKVADATSTNFFRASGINSHYGPRNLVELDYFPDSGFGHTWSPTVISTNNRFASSFNYPLEMAPGHGYRVRLAYSAVEQLLRTSVWRDGEPYGLPPEQTLEDVSLASLPDFRVDAVAVCSYSDEQQIPPEFAGSILARGAVDNIEVHLPDPPVLGLQGGFSNSVWQVVFHAQAGWRYVLEQTSDFQLWTAVSWTNAPAQGPVQLEHLESTTMSGSYYRVRAERP